VYTTTPGRQVQSADAVVAIVAIEATPTPSRPRARTTLYIHYMTRQIPQHDRSSPHLFAAPVACALHPQPARSLPISLLITYATRERFELHSFESTGISLKAGRGPPERERSILVGDWLLLHVSSIRLKGAHLSRFTPRALPNPPKPPLFALGMPRSAPCARRFWFARLATLSTPPMGMLGACGASLPKLALIAARRLAAAAAADSGGVREAACCCPPFTNPLGPPLPALLGIANPPTTFFRPASSPPSPRVPFDVLDPPDELAPALWTGAAGGGMSGRCRCWYVGALLGAPVRPGAGSERVTRPSPSMGLALAQSEAPQLTRHPLHEHRVPTRQSRRRTTRPP
jgi:hypothetical protein